MCSSNLGKPMARRHLDMINIPASTAEKETSGIASTTGISSNCREHQKLYDPLQALLQNNLNQ